MTLETLISELSHEEKLLAMDLLWEELSRSPTGYESPPWHKAALEDRLNNPAPEGSLPLEQAKEEIKRRLNARRA